MDTAARHRWIAAHILPHEAEVRGWLRRHVGTLSAADIDDLIQEAYARIWPAKFAAITQGRAYFFTTVRHLVQEQARRARIVPMERLGEIDALRIISEEPEPERKVGARQELGRLRDIVADLPAQCRRAFELRKFEELSQRAIAERMGISEKTVENHLTRALARVLDALAAGPGEQGRAREAPGTRANDANHGND